MNNFFEIIDCMDVNKKNIIATIISVDELGEKLAISDEEIIYNSNPDGVLVKNIEKIIGTNDSKMISINEISVFVEIVGRERRLVICGGGHISIPIIQIGKMLGFYITVLEDRLSFSNNAKAAGADEVICDSFESALDKIKGDKDTFFVIVTRGHRYDQICLEKIINKENAYIGMIGSKVRVRKIKEELIEKNFSAEKIDCLFSPIGLRINAETPSEIAVAIVAEIIKVKNENYRIEGYTKEIFKAIKSNTENIKFAVSTIVSRKGPAPRQIGTKMIVFEDGTTVGTIGGGCVEADIRQKAIDAIRIGKPQLCLVDMTGNEAEDEGMVCGGIIEVLLDTYV